jgi:predicted ArsR family transcriptional regulator
MDSSPSKAALEETLRNADVPLDADAFMRTLIGDLAGTLQDTVGERDAAGFVAVVGARMGERFDAFYRSALRQALLGRTEVSLVLVDLKRRIGGDFYIIEENEERIVFGNRACPFGELVNGRAALCMMTSNVFGHIAAENLGYAKVDVEEAIARGHAGCRVVVHLQRWGASESASGQEYYRVGDLPR